MHTDLLLMMVDKPKVGKVWLQKLMLTVLVMNATKHLDVSTKTLAILVKHLAFLIFSPHCALSFNIKCESMIRGSKTNTLIAVNEFFK